MILLGHYLYVEAIVKSDYTSHQDAELSLRIGDVIKEVDVSCVVKSEIESVLSTLKVLVSLYWATLTPPFPFEGNFH